MTNNLVIIYLTLVGLMIGSAINAIVWRIYVGRKWSQGRSMCPECKHELAAKDLVPVLSWVMLRGRCRYCKAKIHWQYPLVELVTTGLFYLSAVALGANSVMSGVLLGLWLLILTLLIIMAVYDARWMILPDKIMYPTIVVAAGLLVVRMVQAHSWVVGRGPVLAALIAGGGFFAMVYFSKGRAMGGGDIKLAFLMGLLLGLKGTALAMLIAFNVAAVVGITLIIVRKRGRRDQIPFGPFLVLGTVVAYLYGNDIINWYLQINGLG